MAYSRRQIAQAQQLYKIASDAAYTHRAATQELQKIAMTEFQFRKKMEAGIPDSGSFHGDLVDDVPALIEENSKNVINNAEDDANRLLNRLKKPSLLEQLSSLANSRFTSLRYADVPLFLKKMTKGQAAGGALGLAALLGGGAYLLSDDSKKEDKKTDALKAIMGSKNLSEEQRRKLLRNLGIGAGAALGGYGLYRALK